MKTVLKVWDPDGDLYVMDIVNDSPEYDAELKRRLQMALQCGWHYELEFEPTFQDLIDSKALDNMDLFRPDDSPLGFEVFRDGEPASLLSPEKQQGMDI